MCCEYIILLYDILYHLPRKIMLGGTFENAEGIDAIATHKDENMLKYAT